MQSDPVIDDAANAILEGTAPDWESLESSDDLETRALTEQLKVLSAVARVHHAELLPDHLGQWGHLQLLEKVGSGASGDVFRAWDTRLDREVALKLLPAGAGSSGDASPIIEEGRLLARVRHANVATIYGAELIDGRIGLWMEFVRGRTLEALLRSGHQFSLQDAAQIVIELCRAVSAVHAAGLLHRDIKAQNVMRADDGRLVLMDFGTGRDQSDAEASPAGTPLYLAPEVFDGQPATAQSDVYSVGVLLYRLLSGSYPVNATSAADLRRAHEQADRTNLQSVRPDLPPSMLRIVERATAADPAGRYQSCDAMAADLQPLSRRPRSRRRLIIGLAAAGIVIAAWGGWTGSMPFSGIAAAILARKAEPAIVVLPFRNMSTEPGSDFLADGLTYELIRNLAIIDGLDVRSAISSFALKGREIELADIGRRLGVTLVLDGSMFQSGDQVRVQAQLTQVGADKPLWSNKFDRRITDVLTIQDEISRAVVNQLRLTLGKGQRRYNLDQETLTLYLKGRVLAERRRTEDAQAAVKQFEQVIARDAAFAPAYAGLCTAYGFMSQSLPDVLGMPHQQALGLMRAAAEKAMELDPLLAEAHAAMGFLHSRDFDRADIWEAADRSFRRAIELNPSLTHVYTAYSLTTLLPLGRFEEAEALLKEAIRRDPESLDARRELALQQLTSGQYEDALRTLEHISTLDPKYPVLDLLLARAQSLSGRIEKAMPYWESVKDIVGSQQWMAYAFVRNGRRSEIEQLAAIPQHPYRMVLYQAALGNNDAAFEALDRAVDEAPHRTVRLLQYPELAGLRDDPRFETIRARFHLR